MNLLVTNTQEDQAYLIVRSLCGSADRIVVALGGEGRLQRWGGMSAWSRHVRKRYRVPDCAADWRTGALQAENTPAEERYIRRIEEICALERIDCVFPSYDAEVYVFSKNRGRLARRGVVAVVPDFDGLARILDKSLTVAAAERVGFPVPRTRLPGSLAELRHAAAEIGPPWVIKPRCNAHAMNVRFARDAAELEQYFAELSASQERPLLQEFVPTESKRNYYLMIDRDSGIRSVFTPKVHRLRRSGVQMPCAAVESTREVPREREVRALVKELGVWGGVTLQTIVDARDGQPKLLEINPRLGRNLWFRTELGINEPLMYLRIAQGGDPGQPPPVEQGVLMLDPLGDLLHLMGQTVDQSIRRLRARAGRDEGRGDDPFRERPLGALARDLRSDYFGSRRRVTSPLGRVFTTDPMPPLVRAIRTFCEAVERRVS